MSKKLAGRAVVACAAIVLSTRSALLWPEEPVTGHLPGTFAAPPPAPEVQGVAVPAMVTSPPAIYLPSGHHLRGAVPAPGHGLLHSHLQRASLPARQKPLGRLQRRGGGRQHRVFLGVQPARHRPRHTDRRQRL